MNDRKLRPILKAYDYPVIYGDEEPFHVLLENQDGSLANTGHAFSKEHEAKLFMEAITFTLRHLGMLAPPKKPVSEKAEKRLRELCNDYRHAKFSMEQEQRAYSGTRAPSSAISDGARWKARRYRLALWAVGRIEDARTVTL